MTSETLNLNRRQFMLAGTAAIAAPLIMKAVNKFIIKASWLSSL